MAGEAEDLSLGTSEAEPNGTLEPRDADTALASAGRGVCAELGALPAGALGFWLSRADTMTTLARPEGTADGCPDRLAGL